MRIYITHPYGRRLGLTDDQLEERAMQSIELERKVLLKGHNTYNPLMKHYVHKGWNDSLDENKYFYLVADWIQFCDALLFTQYSDGCKRELDIAKELGKIIYYSLKDIPNNTLRSYE